MSKLTDYYKFEVLKVLKSHRFDCTASTGNYEPLEGKYKTGRDKLNRLYCYYNGVPDTFSANAQRKADRAITDGGCNWSSVYTPDLDNPLLGYGDLISTKDAMLFVFSEDYKQMEVFIARGLKNNVKGLFALLTDGELAEEMEALRQQATPTNAPKP